MNRLVFLRRAATAAAAVMFPWAWSERAVAAPAAAAMERWPCVTFTIYRGSRAPGVMAEIIRVSTGLVWDQTADIDAYVLLACLRSFASLQEQSPGRADEPVPAVFGLKTQANTQRSLLSHYGFALPDGRRVTIAELRDGGHLQSYSGCGGHPRSLRLIGPSEVSA